MSWPQWSSGSQPSVPPVLNPATPVINSAPAVMPPGLQYTQDQWTQLQQQNWHQWAQWQQQYQQWHQQYGAEYQKSINALAQAAQQSSLPNVAVPPPLPTETRPPLPTEDPPPPVPSYSTAPPSTQHPSYNTAPAPKPNDLASPSYPKNNQNQNWQSQNSGYPQDVQQNKRSFEQQGGRQELKRQMINKPGWQSQPPPPPQTPQQNPPPSQTYQQNQRPPQTYQQNQPPPTVPQTTRPAKDSIEELSEAEKKFDKQFAEWEAQFNKWKEQNVEHPDKEQYREYEKKWESWRAQLLERREQMKRKRLGLTADLNKSRPAVGQSYNSPQQNYSHPQPNYNQPPPKVGSNLPLTQKQPLPHSGALLPTPSSPFNKPPPNLNDEPLKFKQGNKPLSVPETEENVGDFIKPNTGGGIPGLDLVKDDPKPQKETEDVVVIDPEHEKKGPDFDAISKGINNILGDQKLLNMLSIVSQNQNPKSSDNLTNTVSKIKDTSNPGLPQVPYHEQSNQSYEDHSNQSDGYGQREFVNNFDDQTRSSFTMAHNEQEMKYDNFGRNQKFDQGRNQKFDQNQFSNRFDNFNKNTRLGPTENDQYDRNNFNRNDFNGRQYSSKPESLDRLPPRSDMPPDRRFSSQPPRNDAVAERFGPGNERQFATPRGDLNQDRFGPNQNRFGPNQDRFSSDKDGYGPNQDWYDSNSNRFGGSNQDRFKPNQNRFGPNQNRFGSDQGRFGPSQDRFGADKDRLGSNQDRFGPNEDRFGPGQDRFASNQDRFKPGQDRYGPSQDRFDTKQDRFGPNQEKFGLGQDRFSGRQFGAPRNDYYQNNPDDYYDEDSFIPNNDRNLGARGGPVERQMGLKGDAGLNRQYSYENDDFGGEPFESDEYNQGPSSQDNYEEKYDYEQPEPRYDEPIDPNVPVEDVNMETSWKEEKNCQEESFKEPSTTDTVAPVTPKSDILQPATVIDYDHKSLKSDDTEVLVEPIYMFDYRHKPLSRIPLPQRPKWLSETVRNIREFDPPVVRPYEPPNLRRYPPPVDNWRKDRYPEDHRLGHSRRNYENRPQFEERRPTYGDNRSYEESKNYNRDWSPSRDNRKREDRKGEGKQPSYHSTDYEEEKISDTEWPEDEDTQQPSENPDFSKFQKPEIDSKTTTSNKNAVLIEDLIYAPGRYNRPPRIVIILRGPPGSGKTFLAKLIKDKEVENGGSTPRILSLDDYFMVEQEKEITEEGKKVKIKEMVYEYEAEMEESYRTSLVKSFKKTITDGYFSFIIVDNVNEKVKYFGEMWSFAKQNGFQVYICQLDLDVQTCSKRNIHGRSEADIEKCVAGWEQTPSHHPTLDATSLLQSASIPEVEMEEVNSPEAELNEAEGSEDQVARSKWDNFDCSVDNLAKLDGVSKPLRHSKTMEEYLQLDTEWTPTAPTKPGQKRVRWADLEEQKQQEKMRAIGFVVGQTNWDRMMDPTMGGSALTQTKYIERTGRFKVDYK